MPLPHSFDVIDRLAGIETGSALVPLRDRRPVTREHAQASHDALFTAGSADVSLAERLAVAAFVAGLHAVESATLLYRGRLEAEAPALVAPVERETRLARAEGPFGAYPPGPLSCEDTSGLLYSADAEARRALGSKLAAAFEHVHLLVFHPRDASRAGLARLHEAGWSATGIVTLSQIVAFLAFQLRVATGLAALKN